MDIIPKGIQYWLSAFGPILIFIAGTLFGKIDQPLSENEIHLWIIVSIVLGLGILFGLFLGRKNEREYELLNLRIQILELEIKIHDIESKLID